MRVDACTVACTGFHVEIEVPLTCCPNCGGQVHNRGPLTQYIEEIPPVRPHVTPNTGGSLQTIAIIRFFSQSTRTI